VGSNVLGWPRLTLPKPAEKESFVRFVAQRLWQVGVATETISMTTPVWGALVHGREIMRRASEAGVSERSPEYQRLLSQVRSVDSTVLAAIQFVYSPELERALKTWKPLASYQKSEPPRLVGSLDKLYLTEGASFDEFYDELEELMTLIDARLKAHPTWLVPLNAKAHLEALEDVQKLANELWVMRELQELN